MYNSGSRLKSFPGWELFEKLCREKGIKKGRFLMNCILVAYNAFHTVIGQIAFLIKQRRKGRPNVECTSRPQKTKQDVFASC